MDNTQNEVIIESVENLTVLVYSHYVVLAFLLYDTALLFDNEVKYFWQPPKKFLSYLYFVARYNGILYTILQLILSLTLLRELQQCDSKKVMLYLLFSSVYPIIEGTTGYFSIVPDVLSILSLDYILLLRVRAIYSKGRIITIILAIMFAIEGISGIVIGVQGVVGEKPQPFTLAPGLTYCVIFLSDSAEHTISWCIPLVYGILLMTLAVHKSAKILKEDLGLSTARIIKIIVRDQVVYFMALILISTNAIVNNFIPSSLPVLVVQHTVGSVAILSSVAARLLLNMKEAGAKGLSEGMGSIVSKATVSGMDFAEPLAQTSTVSAREDRGVHEEIEMVEV